MIRAASSPADFELCADIFNEVSAPDRATGPEFAETVGDFFLYGEEGYLFSKKSVAVGWYAMVRVRPAARRRGIGSALLETVTQPKVWGRLRDEGSLAFALHHGFREVGRDIEVVLQVKPGDGGYRDDIVEQRDEHMPGAYAVAVEATPETALPLVAEAPSYEEWLEREAHPSRAVTFVALDGDEVVGFAGLTRLDGMPHRLENYLTAVKKSHRRRGIALALKQAEIRWAADHGYTEIVSDMVEANTAMRAVNAALGYVEQAPWIVVER